MDTDLYSLLLLTHVKSAAAEHTHIIAARTQTVDMRTCRVGFPPLAHGRRSDKS